MSRAKKATRAAFREAVFARDGGRCVNCGEPAVDAHHLVSRDEFRDGGYHVDNGVALCGPCHEGAECGNVGAQDLRDKAGIKTPYLPNQSHELAKSLSALLGPGWDSDPRPEPHDAV